MNKPMTNNEMKDWEAKTWDRCQKQAWSEPMNREEIIRMAREAELHCHVKLTEHGLIIEDLQYFANLVATAEREACAKVVEELGRGHGSAFAEFECAAAIRARSKE